MLLKDIFSFVIHLTTDEFLNRILNCQFSMPEGLASQHRLWLLYISSVRLILKLAWPFMSCSKPSNSNVAIVLPMKVFDGKLYI